MKLIWLYLLYVSSYINLWIFNIRYESSLHMRNMR